MCTLPVKIRVVITLLLLNILFSGCGDSPQPVVDIEENVVDSYKLTEQQMPDPQEAMPEEFWEDPTWTLREEESYLVDGDWYLLSLFYIKGSGAVSACMQVMDASYDQWESHEISYRQLKEITGGWVESVAGVDDEGVLLELTYPEKDEHVLGYYRWDGTWEPLLEISESLNDALWCRTQEGLWAASGVSRIMSVFDQEGQERYSQSLSGKVVGIIENPAENTFFWYGFEREELVLWNRENGEVTRRVTDQINPYGDFCMAYSSAGELLLADMEHVWLYGEEAQESRELFSFQEMGFPLDEIYGCGIQDDGTLFFYVGYDGEKYLLTAEVRDTTEGSEKQEITIAVNELGVGMRKLIAKYNRQSENYYATIIMPTEGESLEDYHRRIQLEMAAGRGPDLIGQYVINEHEAAAQGYLEPLDGVVGDMSLFLESAFQSGQIDGVTYGIPYSCRPYFLTVSKQVTEKTSWTLEEMMEEVRNSPAEVLEYGRNGVGIVMYYGLYDEENKALIDWEKGESHLTETTFLELLAFAKKYADTGTYPEEELMQRLGEGTIAGADLDITNPGELNKMKNCFGGEEVLIGYPRESGNGIYINTRLFYMNRGASAKEGAIDFLQYLLSEEGQRKYMEYNLWENLSVRNSVNEYSLERYQRSIMDPPVQRQEGNRFYWEETFLDDEQINQFWWLLDKAIPEPSRAEELRSLVEEELEPYFNGDRSAEEVAAVLDSRVQLYLDERE